MKKTTMSVLAFLVTVCVGNLVSAQMAQLSEEHKTLKNEVGVWDAEVTMWMAPGEDPIKSKGTETNTMLGEMWVLSKFEGDIMGSPFIGQGTTGFDPIKKKFVATWVDSMTPHITHMLGTFDAESKTMTMLSKSIGPDGNEAEGKSNIVYKNENTRLMTMYMKVGDDWVKNLEIKYTRKKK